MSENLKNFSGDINRKGVPLSHKIAKATQLKWIIMLLPLVFVVITLMISMVGIFKKSFVGAEGFTLEYYTKIFTEPLYIKVLLNTLKMGLLVTLFCLLILRLIFRSGQRNRSFAGSSRAESLSRTG